jgi:hypothetical protein
MKRVLLFLFLFLSVQSFSQVGRFPFYTSSAVDIYCPEYRAVYDAFSVKPSDDTALMQNAMVKSLVDDGYWARMDVFYCAAVRTNSGGDAFINWYNPGTFDITDPGSTAPTFTAYQGFDGDGSSDYLSTNFNLHDNAIHITQNSTTIAAYCRSAINDAQMIMGVADAAFARTSIYPRSDGNFISNINSGDLSSLSNATSLGLIMSVRRGANETEGYMNGASLGSDTDASTGLPDHTMYLLCLNNNGSNAVYFSGEVSIWFIMNAVSDAEALAIKVIIETYMDAIGKGVIAFKPMGIDDLLYYTMSSDFPNYMKYRYIPYK